MVEWIDNTGDYCGPGDIGLVTYLEFARGLHCYLSRADEPGLSITGELTLGGWVWLGSRGRSHVTAIIGKWYEPTEDRSYVLYKDALGFITFSISESGTSLLNTITDNRDNSKVNKWHYIVGRFAPSKEIALFVDGEWYVNSTDIAASIHDSSEPFEIGRYNRSNYFDGRLAHMFVSAEAIEDSDIEAMYAHTKAMFQPPKEHEIVPTGVNERMTNAALNIEYGLVPYIRMTNGSVEIEYTPASYIRMTNAALEIEYQISPDIYVTDFAINVEHYITDPIIRVTNFAINIERQNVSYIVETNAALMIEYYIP
jgi:hypothetical protein